jgi:hypothetical protein
MSFIRKKLHQSFEKVKTTTGSYREKWGSESVCFTTKTNWYSFTGQGNFD